MEEDLSADLIRDLLRSAWIVESARSLVHQRWDAGGAGAKHAADRAAIVSRALTHRGAKTDPDMVEGHAAWIESLVGRDEAERALGRLLLARLGEWVDAHASHFLEPTDDFKELGMAEKQGLTWPEQLPAAPPFEPLAIPDVAPPGEVKLRFGILGDLHIGSPLAEVMATAAIDDLNASGAELVIQLGDITEHGNAEEFTAAAKILARLAMPFATMMGNHDVVSLSERRLSGRELYPLAFGREPDGVLLEHKGRRFAVLDSAENATSPFPPFNLVTGAFVEGPGGAIVRGSLTLPQHELLAYVAAPGAPPAFVFLHHPPQPFTAFPPVIFGLRDADSGRLHAVADSGNVWGVFAGHTHRNARTRLYGAVPVHEVAIARDYPFGFALVDVTDAGYCFRFRQISNEDLLREAYAAAGILQRRYAGGDPPARAFSWTT